MIQSTLLIFSLLVFTPSPFLLASDSNQCVSDINYCGGCTPPGSGSIANPQSFLPCSVISLNDGDITLNTTEWVYSYNWLESETYALQLPLTISNNTNGLIPAPTATGGCNALSLTSSPSMYASGTCAQISIDAPISKNTFLYYGYGSGQDLPYSNSSLLWDSPVFLSTGDYHSSAILHYEDPYVLVNNSKISTGTSATVIRLNNAPSNVFPSYTNATAGAIYFSIHNKKDATIEQTTTSDLVGWDNWINEMINTYGSSDTYYDNSVADRQAIIDASMSVNTTILNEGSLFPYRNVSGYVDVTGSRYLTYTQGNVFNLPAADSGGYPSPPLFTATPFGYGAENLTLNIDGQFETDRSASPSLFDDTNNTDTTVNVNNPLISTQDASLINTGNGFTLNNYSAIECSNSSGPCIDSSLTSTSEGGKVTYNIRNNSSSITNTNSSGPSALKLAADCGGNTTCLINFMGNSMPADLPVVDSSGTYVVSFYNTEMGGFQPPSNLGVYRLYGTGGTSNINSSIDLSNASGLSNFIVQSDIAFSPLAIVKVPNNIPVSFYYPRNLSDWQSALNAGYNSDTNLTHGLAYNLNTYSRYNNAEDLSNFKPVLNLPLSGSSTPFKSLTISGTAKIGSGSVISLLDGASAPTVTSTNAPDSGVTLELSGYTGNITSSNLTAAYDTLVYNGGVGSFTSNQTVDAKDMNNQNISLQGVFKPASSYSSSLTNLNQPVVTLKSGGAMDGSTYHTPFIPTMSLASGGSKGKFVFDLSQDSTMGMASFTVTDIFSQISFLSANVLPQWDITLGNNLDISLDGSLCTSGSCPNTDDFTLNTSQSTVKINNNTSRDDFISGLIRGTGKKNTLSLNAGGTASGLTLNLGASETFSKFTTNSDIGSSSFTLKSGGSFDGFSGAGNTLDVDGATINNPSKATLSPFTDVTFSSGTVTGNLDFTGQDSTGVTPAKNVTILSDIVDSSSTMTLPASSKVVLTSGVTTLPKFTASNSTFELGTTSDNAYSGVSPSITGSGNILHIKNTLSSLDERSYSFGKAFPFNFISSDTTDVSGLSLTIESGYSVPQGSVAIPQFANMSNELIISGVDLSDFEPTLKGYSHVDLKSGTLGYLNFSDSNVDVSVSEGVSFVGVISSVSNFFSVDGPVAALSLVGTLSTPWENGGYPSSVDNAIDFNFASIDGFSINLGTGKVFDRFVHSVPGTITNSSFTLYDGWSACLGNSSLIDSTLTFKADSSFNSTDYVDPSDSVTCESGGVIPLSGSNNTLVLDGISSNSSDLTVGIAGKPASSVNFGTSFSALSLKDGQVNSIDANGVIVDYYNDFTIVDTNTVNSVNLPNIKLQNGTLVLYDGSTTSNSHKVRKALDYAATQSVGSYEKNKLIYAGATIDGDTFQLGTVDGVKSAFNSIEFTYNNSFTESEVTNSTLLLGEGVDSTFSVTSNSVDYSHDNTLSVSGASGISLTSGILAPVFTKLDLVSGGIKSLDTTNMYDQIVELKGGVALEDPTNFVLKMHDGRFIVSLDDDAGASDSFNDSLFTDYLTAFSNINASGSTNSSGNELIIKNTFSPSNVSLGLGSGHAFNSVTSYDSDYTDATLSPIFEDSIITLSSNAILPVLDTSSSRNKLILDGIVLSNGLSDTQSTGYNSLVLKTGTLSANQSIDTTGMSSSANVSLDDSFQIGEGSHIVLNDKNFTVNSCTSAADVVSVITGSGNTLNVLPTAGTCSDLDINLSSNSPFDAISSNSKVSESTFYLGDGSIVPELHSDSSQNTLVVQGLTGDVDLSDTSAYAKVQLTSSNSLSSVNIPPGVDLIIDGSPTFTSDFAIIMSNASLHLNSSTVSSDYYQRVLDSLDASFDGSDDTDLASNVTLVVDQNISGLDIKMGKNTATGGGNMYPITSVKTTSSVHPSSSSSRQSTSGSISDSSITLYEGSTVPSFSGSNDTLHVDTYDHSSIITPSSFSTVNFTANSVVENAVIQANSPTLNNYSDTLQSVTQSGGVINLFTEAIPEVTGSHVDLFLNQSVSAPSTTINLGFGHALDSLTTVSNATLDDATIHVSGNGSVFDLATNVQVSGHGNTLELSNLRLEDSVQLSDTSTYQSLVLSKSTLPSINIGSSDQQSVPSGNTVMIGSDSHVTGDLVAYGSNAEVTINSDDWGTGSLVNYDSTNKIIFDLDTSRVYSFDTSSSTHYWQTQPPSGSNVIYDNPSCILVVPFDSKSLSTDSTQCIASIAAEGVPDTAIELFAHRQNAFSRLASSSRIGFNSSLTYLDKDTSGVASKSFDVTEYEANVRLPLHDMYVLGSVVKSVIHVDTGIDASQHGVFLGLQAEPTVGMTLQAVLGGYSNEVTSVLKTTNGDRNIDLDFNQSFGSIRLAKRTSLVARGTSLEAGMSAVYSHQDGYGEDSFTWSSLDRVFFILDSTLDNTVHIGNRALDNNFFVNYAFQPSSTTVDYTFINGTDSRSNSFDLDKYMSATAGWHGVYDLSNNVSTAMTAAYSTNKLLTASISLQYNFSHNSSDERNEPLPDYWPSRSTWSGKVK